MIVILFSPLIEGGTTQLPVLVIRLVVLSAGGVWIIGRLRTGSLKIPINGIGPPVMLFLLWAGLSLLWSPYKNPSAQWFLSLLTYTLLFMLVVHTVQKPQHIQVLLLLFLGMGLFQGIIGIAQYAYLGEARSKGTFFNPNFFAAYEATIFILALCLAAGRYRLADSKYLPGLWVITVAITGLAVVMAQSRGALLALLVVLSVLGIHRFGRLAIVGIVVCVLIGVIVPNPLRQRIADVSSQDPYAYSRIDMWKNSLQRIGDHPLGLGLAMYKYGSFQSRFPTDDHIVRYKKRAESAHNEYLQLGVELGIVGLVLFLAGAGIWLHNMWLAYRASSDGGLLHGLIGIVLLLLVHAGVDSVFHEPALVVVLIVASALACNVYVYAFPAALKEVSLVFRYSRLHACLVWATVIALSVFFFQPVVAWYAHDFGKQEAAHGNLMVALDRFASATVLDPGTTAYHDSAAWTAIQLFERSRDPKWLIMASEEEALAHDLNPLDGRFPYRLGTIYMLLSQQAQLDHQKIELRHRAERAYRDAIHADPYTPFSYYELAKLLFPKGKRDEALRLLRTATEHEPNFLPGRALLAEISLGAGLPGNYGQELSFIKTIAARYEGQARDEIEQQFVKVDLYPLSRAIAAREKQ